MKEQKINSLVKDFNELANSVQNELNEMLVVLSVGKVPGAEIIESFNQKIKNLHEKYTTIYSYAKSTLSEEELIPMGEAVSEYVQAIENSKSRVLKEQLNNIKNVLSRFLTVSSLIAAYSEALQPFQDEARGLLNQLNTEEPEDVSELLEVVTAPEIFIKIIDTSDLDSDKGIELLEKAGEFYPIRVQNGLARKAYFFDEIDVAINDTVAEVDNGIETTEVATEKSEEIDNNRSEREDKALYESESVKKQVEVAVTEIAEIREEETPANDVVANNALLVAVNKIKTSTPSASSFKKEIIKLPKEIRTILPLFTNMGILTEEQIHKFGVCMDCFYDNDEGKEKVICALEILANKGLIAKYLIEELNINAYCLTNYAYSCMMKDTISSQMKGFWAITYGQYKVCGKEEINQSMVMSVISKNESLLKYFYGIKKSLSDDEYYRVKASIKRSDKSCKVLVVCNDENICCEIISNNDELATSSCDHILFILDNTEYPESVGEQCKRLFVYSNENIIECQLPLSSGNSVRRQLEIVLEDKINNDSEEIMDKTTEEISASDEQIEGSDEKQEDLIEEAMTEQIGEYKDEPQSLAEDIDEIAEEDEGIPTDEEFCKMINEILDMPGKKDVNNTSSIIRALLLSKTASLVKGNTRCKDLYNKLLVSSALPIDEFAYTSSKLSEAFGYMEPEYECMMLASYLYALLVPGVAYDHGIKSQSEQFLFEYDTYFPSLTCVKSLFNKLIRVRELLPNGFSSAIIAVLGDAAENEKFVRGLQAQAKDLLTLPNIKTRMKALRPMYSNCFGSNSDLYNCMQIIVDNKNSEEDVEFVELVLSEYCYVQDGIFTLHDRKIGDKLNEAWYAVNPGNRYELEFDAKQQALRQFNSRLTLMKTWVEHKNNTQTGSIDIARVKSLRNEILKLIEETYVACQAVSAKYINVLLWMLRQMKWHLTAKIDYVETFSELLHTGIISMDDKGLPIINEAFIDVKYYEPWRNVLKHINYENGSIEIARSEIFNIDSDMFDNLHQLQLISHFFKEDGEEYDYHISEGQLNEAIRNANERKEQFKEKLELAYTYNRISETQKESLLSLTTQYEKLFYEIKDFGCWKQFLKALERQIDELAAKRKRSLRESLNERIAKLKDGETSELLKEAELLLERDLNFAVTEEYINRFDTGDTELTDEINAILHDEDLFSQFISDEVFSPLYNECMRWSGQTSKSLKNFGWDYLEKHIPNEWTSRLREDSKKLIQNWPVRKGNTTTVQIENLFTSFGLNIKNVTKVNGRKEEMFQLQIIPTARSMADYRHPIAAFGTQIKSPINVIVLYGNYTAKQLVDTISSMDLGGTAMVLIDRPLDRTVRRQIAEIFHTQTSGQNPFLLIDQVLTLYLAMHQVTERLPALLKCTLPYTTYQPFVRDGGSTADEMFCGRTRELATIIDPNGACVVYGGRQLGKTALLERAESRCMKLENHAYAVYSNIIGCKTEAAFVAKVIEDIQKKTDLTFAECDTIGKLCSQFDKLYRSKRIETMLLLLDEADNFLASIVSDNYKQIQPLIDLKRETKNNFKFVIAGLHNVCRAKNATTRNGIFGQLGTPLCVKPLSPTDALQLLSRPLRYLGFQIDRYPHLETILTNTNYYPGILQFFGYMLVETLTGQYGKYYHAVDGNPPFTLQDDQLGAVMNSADLNRSIRDKFRWSLELDPRYFMLARCIAVLYYLQDERAGHWLGFPVNDIMEIALEYDIHCLENVSEIDFEILLDEMVEMGILSRPQKGLYRLRRNSFIDIIGSTFDELDADIEKNNAEVE